MAVIPCPREIQLILGVETWLKLLKVLPGDSNVHICLKATIYKSKIFPSLFLMLWSVLSLGLTYFLHHHQNSLTHVCAVKSTVTKGKIWVRSIDQVTVFHQLFVFFFFYFDLIWVIFRECSQFYKTSIQVFRNRGIIPTTYSQIVQKKMCEYKDTDWKRVIPMW